MPKPKLNFKFDISREQVFAVGGFCALLMLCAITVAGALQARSNALQHLAEQRDELAALEASRGRLPTAVHRPRTCAAPASGLPGCADQRPRHGAVPGLSCPTWSTSQRAVLVSSGVPAERDDKSDAIRLQISLNATLPALQSLLYRLESGTPYVFVDALLVQPGGSAERSAPAMLVLKVNLTVHAFWRRRTA